MTEPLSRSPITKRSHAIVCNFVRNFLYVGRITGKMKIKMKEAGLRTVFPARTVYRHSYASE